ncbi:zinc finger protein 345-like [Acipenser oxyrinchus oxyrinchus]|uniref:Zinc finger protein 345-like n=1 Tax=Acipenser oxyrinchus oxyrinchus TaxID=40147 RepID=A0AAD8CEK3_ACIOX|nr:zinc finger protein 345-like [Acipenser oxyrinchus oxyrinchus]
MGDKSPNNPSEVVSSNWQYTYICSVHFPPDSFEERPMMMAEMGLDVKRRRILKPNAVPTILKQTQAAGTDVGPQTKRPRKAFEKREKSRVADSILSTERGMMVLQNGVRMKPWKLLCWNTQQMFHHQNARQSQFRKNKYKRKCESSNSPARNEKG